MAFALKHFKKQRPAGWMPQLYVKATHKTCRACGQRKPVADFARKKLSCGKLEYRAHCEACRAERPPLGSHWHRPDRLKRCIRCKEQKPLTAFSKRNYVTKNGKGRPSIGYESRCKPCACARVAERTKANPEHVAALRRATYRRNHERTRQYQKDQRARYAAHNARYRVGRGLKSNDPPEIRALYAEAARITALIQCCPVWDLPELQKSVHVDHKIPISKGGKHVIENLQLLPAGLNMRKGNRCPL